MRSRAGGPSLVFRGIAVLVAVAAPAALRASPVMDDESLARGFVERLGGLADTGGPLGAAAVTAGATAVRGLATTIPPVAGAVDVAAGGPLYDAVLPAVVALTSVYQCDKCTKWHGGGLATGWIAAEGLVVTNHHCLDLPAGHLLGAMTADGEVFAVTDVVAVDPDADAAVLRIDTRGRRLPRLALGDPPSPGAVVTTIGHPRGRFYCLTQGVVSRYHRHRRRDQAASAVGEPRTWLSVTAEFAVGSSGGPVLDPAGRVVGMVSRTAEAPRPASPPDQGGKAPRPEPPAGQMTFRDCVSLESLRGLLRVAPSRSFSAE